MLQHFWDVEVYLEEAKVRFAFLQNVPFDIPGMLREMPKFTYF